LRHQELPARAWRNDGGARDAADLVLAAEGLFDAFSAISAPEVGAALDALMRWIETGAKPTPQSIAAACEELRASLDAPCTYHPEFTPKPLNTRYYPREITVR
jgi:hypothetical protein